MRRARSRAVSAALAALGTALHRGNLAGTAAGPEGERNGGSDCVRGTGGVLVRDERRLDGDVRARRRPGRRSPCPALPTGRDRRMESVRAKAGTPVHDGTRLGFRTAGHEAVLGLVDAEIAAGRHDAVPSPAPPARSSPHTRRR